MRVADAKGEFERLLAVSELQSGDTHFLTTWHAFKAFARVPVEDIADPGTESDTLECAFTVDYRSRDLTPDSLATQVVLRRQFEVPTEPHYHEMCVLSTYPVPPPGPDGVSIHGLAGTQAEVANRGPDVPEELLDPDAFVAAVEAHPFFEVLSAAGDPSTRLVYQEPIE